LKAEGIDTRRYFSPPVHQMAAYQSLRGANGHMPVTEAIAASVLTLPMWDGISDEQVGRVATAVTRIANYRRAS
jgi:dTDP-4-amino-4,6-dideoxygalactose transaminase